MKLLKQLLHDFWTGVLLLFWIWPKPKYDFRFSTMKVPLVRRIYPSLIADKIVSVQPLLEPTGLKYYLNYRYATTKNDIARDTTGACRDL